MSTAAGVLQRSRGMSERSLDLDEAEPRKASAALGTPRVETRDPRGVATTGFRGPVSHPSDRLALMMGLGELIALVLSWWRAPRPPSRTWEQDAGGGYVFCQLCRDWHPPANCAGEWP
jgi:hypothetical protein